MNYQIKKKGGKIYKINCILVDDSFPVRQFKINIAENVSMHNCIMLMLYQHIQCMYLQICIAYCITQIRSGTIVNSYNYAILTS